MNIERLATTLKQFMIDLKQGDNDGLVLSTKDNECFMLISPSSLKKGYQINYINTNGLYKRQGYATNLYRIVKWALNEQRVNLDLSNSHTKEGNLWVQSLDEK